MGVSQVADEILYSGLIALGELNFLAQPKSALKQTFHLRRLNLNGVGAFPPPGTPWVTPYCM